MTEREDFERALGEEGAAAKLPGAVIDACNREWLGLLRELYRAAMPRRKDFEPPPGYGEEGYTAGAFSKWAKRLGKHLPEGEWSRLGKEIEEKHLPAYRAATKAHEDAKGKAFDEAYRCTPLAGPERRLFHRVSESTYRSQPSSLHYARCDAEIRALRAEAFSIPNEVVERKESWGSEFEVWVMVKSELDLEILKRRNFGLREEVRLCWRKGVDPRVMMPFLPHGYEEKQGLDFFGNDLRKKEVV